jgi:hypothetical protein
VNIEIRASVKDLRASDIMSADAGLIGVSMTKFVKKPPSPPNASREILEGCL